MSRNYELLSALEQAENGGNGAFSARAASATAQASAGGPELTAPEVDAGTGERADGQLSRKGISKRSFAKENPEEAQSESIIYSELSQLVQQVFLGALETRRTVIFCGVDRESAAISSWVCTQAAELLAGRVAGFVCMVDSNPESLSGRPSEVEKLAFEVGEANGFPGTLLRIRGNLWLSSDKLDANAGARSGIAGRIEQLRKTFEYVLVDAPAISMNSETPIFGRAADGVVMMLEAFSTRREAALKAKERIQASGGKLIGIVLNDRRFPIPEKLYRRL